MDYSNMPAPTPPVMTDSQEVLPQFPPTHPVPSMQEAFEESMYEQNILMFPSGVGSDFKPQFHRLEKLVSQVAFGMHLLHKQLAISETEVVRIMQGHVNEMDDFLSRTTSSLDSRKKEIVERIKNMKVPLDSDSNVARTFDKLLMDAEYRKELLEDNERVEYVVKVTIKSLYKALKSVSAGLKGVDALGRYLTTVRLGWASKNLQRVYNAMVQNVEQWYRCLVGLQAKGISLGEKLQVLKVVIRKIEKRAVRASKKAIVISMALTDGSLELTLAQHHISMRSSQNPQMARRTLTINTNLSVLKPLPLSPAVTPIIFTLHDNTPPPTPLRPRSQRSYTRSRPLHSPVSPLTRNNTVTTNLVRRVRRGGSPVSPLTNRSFSYRKARPLSHPASAVRSRRPSGAHHSKRQSLARHTTYIPSPKIVETDPVLDKIRELQKTTKRKRLSKRAPPIKNAPPTQKEKEAIGVGVWANPPPRRKRCSLGRALLGDGNGGKGDCKIM